MNVLYMLNYPPFKNELTKLKIVYYPKHNREGYSMVAKANEAMVN